MRRLSLILVVLAGVSTRSAGPSETPVLGSTAISWEEIQAKVSANGRYSQVLKAPTATLDELELHVTTLPPASRPILRTSTRTRSSSSSGRAPWRLR